MESLLTCSIENPAESLGQVNDYEITGLFTEYAGESPQGRHQRFIISAPTKDPEKVPTS